ncbi:tata-box binding protein tbp2 [Cyclospora cayetanensis]|uniref:Tata-box binding protein tbp2 n=1 Tax=Cyclospora cayetanensis TaxID=88456 RepID=A0A1D3D7N9_9EIME|nr:tata-box binding protein tbp2 [Cyclospora cayetanensis]
MAELVDSSSLPAPETAKRPRAYPDDQQPLAGRRRRESARTDASEGEDAFSNGARQQSLGASFSTRMALEQEPLGLKAVVQERRHAGGEIDALEDSLMALLLPNACSVAPPSGAEEVSDQRLSGSKGHTEAPACEGEGTSASRASSPPLPAAGKLLPLGAADVLAAAASAENSAAAVAAEAPPVRVQNVIASGRVSVEGRRSACLDLRRIAVSCRLAEYNPRKVNACIIRLRKPKCTGLIFRSALGDAAADSGLRALSVDTGSSSPDGEGAGETASVKAAVAAGGGGSTWSAVGAEQSETCSLTNSAIAARKQETDSQCLPESSDGAGGLQANGRTGRTASKIQLTEFAIENIVATADCGLPGASPLRSPSTEVFAWALMRNSYLGASFPATRALLRGLVYRYNPTPSLKAVLLIFVSGKVVITGCKTAAEIQEVFHSFFPVLLKYHT